METAIPNLDLIFGFLETARTDIVIVVIGLLIWLRIGFLGRTLRTQQEQNLAKLELFVTSEHSLHERLEAVLVEIRELKTR